MVGSNQTHFNVSRTKKRMPNIYNFAQFVKDTRLHGHTTVGNVSSNIHKSSDIEITKKNY